MFNVSGIGNSWYNEANFYIIINKINKLINDLLLSNSANPKSSAYLIAL